MSLENTKIIDGVVVLKEFNDALLPNPAANSLYLYADDSSGETVIKYKTSNGDETVLGSATAAPSPFPSFAFINPENGSDTTGDGSMGKPFQTIQGANNNGYKKFFLAEGDAGTLDVTQSNSGPFWIYGMAAADFVETAGNPGLNPPSSWPDNIYTKCTVRNNAETNNHVHIYSNKGVVIDLIGHSEYKVSGGIGETLTPDFSVNNALIGSIVGTATDGTSEEFVRSVGGNAAIIKLSDCFVLGTINLALGLKQNEENNSLDGDGAWLYGWNTRFFGSISLPGGGATNSNLKTIFSIFSVAPTGSFDSEYVMTLTTA